MFRSPHYIRHTCRRTEHLATLGLDVAGARVLELGAGISDQTTFFLDRKCKVDAVEGRPVNCELYSKSIMSHPYRRNARLLPLDFASAALALRGERYDIVYCYGFLYHVEDPRNVLELARTVCDSMLLLETCVSYGSNESINPVDEDTRVTQALTLRGCRPTRPWIFRQLTELFEFAYMPITQPWHEEFPIDWTPEENPLPELFSRSVFIGSRRAIDNPLLVASVPMTQRRA